MTKILPFLKARFTIVCTRRLQPPHNDCTVRVQWFSSVRPGGFRQEDFLSFHPENLFLACVT